MHRFLPVAWLLLTARFGSPVSRIGADQVPIARYAGECRQGGALGRFTKNDRATRIMPLLRCDLLPQCYMAPVAMRDLPRMLRYRNLVVRQTTRVNNRTAGLLMETGTG